MEEEETLLLSPPGQAVPHHPLDVVHERLIPAHDRGKKPFKHWTFGFRVKLNRGLLRDEVAHVRNAQLARPQI